MKPFKSGTVSLAFLLTSFVTLSYADSVNWQEDTDGDVGPNEYRVIDPHGAVTRRPCPWSCEMRGIPKEHCKEWKSITNAVDGECYVQDLRISKADAMPIDTAKEAQAGMAGYRK